MLTFVNTIADIVHNSTHTWGGQCNKNLGNAFVIVWRIGDEETIMTALQATAASMHSHGNSSRPNATTFPSKSANYHSDVGNTNGNGNTNSSHRSSASAANSAVFGVASAGNDDSTLSTAEANTDTFSTPLSGKSNERNPQRRRISLNLPSMNMNLVLGRKDVNTESETLGGSHVNNNNNNNNSNINSIENTIEGLTPSPGGLREANISTAAGGFDAGSRLNNQADERGSVSSLSTIGNVVRKFFRFCDLNFINVMCFN